MVRRSSPVEGVSECLVEKVIRNGETYSVRAVSGPAVALSTPSAIVLYVWLAMNAFIVMLVAVIKNAGVL